MSKLTKAQTKRITEQYLATLKLIEENTAVNYLESEEDKRARKKRAKYDYAYFVKTYFPHYATYACAWFHIEASRRVLDDLNYKGVMEWARGLAKSTHFTIFMPVWLMLFHDQMKFMALISATKDNAVGLLADLQAELEANAQLKHDFGELAVHGDWKEGAFKTANGSFFLAMGKKGLRRGIRNGPNRPDYFVLDDIDDDVEVENPVMVDKSYKRIMRAARASMDIGVARFIVVNNRIEDYTIMGQFAANPAYDHLKVNALDASGEPNWREKYTKKYYHDLQVEMGPAYFGTEFQNTPTKAGKHFLKKYEQFIPRLQLGEYDRIVAWWDPAYSDSATADFNAMPIVGKKGAQRHIIEAFCKQCKMEEAIAWMYEQQIKVRDSAVIEWYMERQFWDDPTRLAFDKVTKEYAGRCAPIPMIVLDNPGNKFSRIMRLLPAYQRYEWYTDEQLEYNLMYRTGMKQLRGIEKGYRGKDDFPDALDGCRRLLDEDDIFDDFEPQLGENLESQSIY